MTCGVNDKDQEARLFETCTVVGMLEQERRLVPGISARKGGPNKAKSRLPTSWGRVPAEPGSDQLGLGRQESLWEVWALVTLSVSVVTRHPGHSSLVSPDGCHDREEDFLLITSRCPLPTVRASTISVPIRLSLESQPRPENL